MRMPGTLPSNTVYDLPVISIDVSQTVLALGGADLDNHFDGVNLVPYVLGERKTPPHEAIFWRTAQDSKQAVRRGKDKLVILDGQPSLFDVAADLEESIDLAASNPKLVGEISELFEHWNSDNKPAFFPGYREYHELLKEFHRQVLRDAQANDHPKQD